MKKLFSLSCICLFTTLISYAQTPPVKAKVSDLSFIEGSWKAVAGEQTIEATWYPVKGNNIVGFQRIMKDGKLSMLELLDYEQTEYGPVLYAKHFLSALANQEGEPEPVIHRWVESAEGRVVFEVENLPFRVMYEKKSADEFVITLSRLENEKWTKKNALDFKRVK
jgi:hypothetical protein